MSPPRCLRWALLVALSTWCLAAGGSAGWARMLVARSTPASGPMRAGGGVVWDAGGVDLGRLVEHPGTLPSGYDIRIAVPGSRSRSLAHGALKHDLAESGERERVWFAASPRRLALLDAVATFENGGVERGRVSLSAAPLGAAPSRLFSCALSDAASAVVSGGSVDGDGEVVASALQCLPQAVTVRDFARGATVRARTFTIAADDYLSGPVKLAGPYVAYETLKHGLVVADWQTGTVTYTTGVTDHARDAQADAGVVTTFDLQADGTLAAIVQLAAPDFGFCRPAQLVYYLVADPREHVLPAAPCAESTLAISHDRIVFVGRPWEQADDEGSGPEANPLYVSDLGGDVRELAPVGLPDASYPSGMAAGGIDTDGTDVAYAVNNCQGPASIYLQPLTETIPADPIDCPLAVTTRLVRARHHTVAFKLACPRGCEGTARLLAGRHFMLGTGAFAAQGPAAVARVRLSRVGWCVLRNARVVSVRLEVDVHDRAGQRHSVMATITVRA